MAKQRNVQQQNAETRESIRSLAMSGADVSQMHWLHETLKQQGKSPDQGALVQLRCVPEQEGDLYAGMWLDEASKFWAFVVVVSRGTGTVVVESFKESAETSLEAARLPGKGKSFGQLAIEATNQQ